ncbi:hypothetical protein ACEQ8H_004374 [Pleosporales sp. CAS-2024a]
MSAPQRHAAAALTAATIWDDAVYCAQALLLSADQTEDGMESELVLLAEERRVQEPWKFLSISRHVERALSTVTIDSDPRSSASLHSHDTQSTSLTSAPSRTSRDPIHNTDRFPAMPSTTPPVRLSARPSSSTLSVSQSALSDSSSSSHPAPRRRRSGLHCGHSLSPDAIQAHIKEALQSGGQTVPSCCRMPLPRRLLDTVMAPEEAHVLTDKALPSPRLDTIRDSGYNEVGLAAQDTSRSPDEPPQPMSTHASAVPSRRRHEAINIDSALAKEAFKSFQSQEKDQITCVAVFESNQRKALSAHHAGSLKRIAVLHESSKNEKMQQHVLELEHLEEVQIVAEHDLRKAHDVETQNVATALKHMDAYCLNSGQPHSDHAHVVTADDFKKLDCQRMVQQNLPRKHENAINVLRARQERETKNKIRKQEAELSLLDAAYERQRATQEAEFAAEMEKLAALMEKRRRRLQQRWDLKFQMWRIDWETQHNTAIDFDLEHETWPPDTTKTMMTPIPESSALAPYVHALA